MVRSGEVIETGIGQSVAAPGMYPDIITAAGLAWQGSDIQGYQAHGLTAGAMLGFAMHDFADRHRIESTVVDEEIQVTLRSGKAKASLVATLGSYPAVVRDRQVGAAAEGAQVEALLGKYWPQTQYPFTAPSVVRSGGDQATAIWSMTPGPVTEARLATYLASIGLEEGHDEQGAIGHILDVLRVAGKLATIEEVKERPLQSAQPMETYDMLLFKLDDCLDPKQKDVVHTALEQSITAQLRNERSAANLGVIVGGRGSWARRVRGHGGNKVGPHFKEVAKASLATLLENKQDAKYDEAREFLQEQYEGLED